MKKMLILTTCLLSTMSFAGDSYLNCDVYVDSFVEPERTESTYIDRDLSETAANLVISTPHSGKTLDITLLKNGDAAIYEGTISDGTGKPYSYFSYTREFSHYDPVVIYKKEYSKVDISFEQVECFISD